MMNSGWHRLLASPKFSGRDNAGRNHTPGFHTETAHLLLTERNVKGIGVDTLSLDPGLKGVGGAFPVHYEWLGNGRWGVENVANLDALPAKGATLVLGGPKVRGATGGQAGSLPSSNVDFRPGTQRMFEKSWQIKTHGMRTRVRPSCLEAGMGKT